MTTIFLRPADPELDFGQIDALFSREQDEPASESNLKADYEEHKARILRLMVAEDEKGELMGFNWAVRSRNNESQVYFFLIVKPEQRRRGAGSRLYEDLALIAKEEHAKKLQVKIRDDCPECKTFAEKRGFIERSHYINLAMDLYAFDDLPHDNAIAKLKSEGLLFTTMEELGNTEEAQRKLYVLNDTTAMEMPGSDGSHIWPSFEDFQKRVCQADWYKPDGQIIAIDTTTGAWAAMSAITRMNGYDYAFNLHTGVDKQYRGRKLEQAVMVLALRFAREVLKVNNVHTDEDEQNLPMIAVYHELGYTQKPGIISMEKNL
jgi:GNAT superfamily N-acetyltransferase